MKKLFWTIFVMVFCLSVNAKSIKADLNPIISDSKIPKNSISISIRNLDTGKPVYELNEKMLMHPASTQKILTLPAIIEALGEDYEFSTGIYGRKEGEYIIKLGADPFLTSSDLKTLIKPIDNKTVQKISIDDSIIEPKDWGEGWQWDDDLNSYMPKFNSYNLDKNLMKITVMPQNGQTIVINPSKYPLVFLNNVRIGDTNSVRISRESSVSSNTLTLDGTISRPCTVTFPINNLKRYFEIKLTQVMSDRNIYLKDNFAHIKLCPQDKLVESIKHPVSKAEEEILKNSNNMMIETLSKLAGGKVYSKTGTDIDGLKVIDEFYKKNSIDNSQIKLVDTSGVSKNNLVNSDFVTEYLYKLKDNKTLQKMASAGEGTLANRMIPLGENIKAKTGTLSDISSIAGFLTAKSGAKYTFCIIINDPSSTESDKKSLENYMLREIYLKG